MPTTIVKEQTMGTGLNAARNLVALTLVAVFSGACNSDYGKNAPTAPQSSATALAVSSRTNIASAGSTKGAAGQMPAFYDGERLTINSVELPEDASAATIASNRSLNNIYATNDLDEEQDFLPVIDAIQGDGFNPLWRQSLIVFNPGFTPHQFLSDEEVLDAASGTNPEIHLDVTDEVYRCAVVTKK
jgi:hypothetical protein